MQTTRFRKVLLATLLCLKYPFLYPRNRFTGLHYNWWWWREKRKSLYSKYYVFKNIGPHSGPIYYYKELSIGEHFWKVWWALPLIKIMDWIEEYPIQWLHCLPSYTELDALPKTWKEDFGLDWARDVKAYLKKHKIKHYRIAQLKEKWGEFDWLHPPTYSDDECMRINQRYIQRSKDICICCGRTATMVTPIHPWKNYYCKKCAPDYAYPKSRVMIRLNAVEFENLKKLDPGEVCIYCDDYDNIAVINNKTINLNNV